MKKKRIIIIAVVAVVAIIAIIVAVKAFNNSSDNSMGSSRRDSQITDEDLWAVDGSNSLSNEGACGPESAQDATSEATIEVVEEIEANNPVVNEVDAVKRIVIPEAVTITDGNRGDFYSNEDFMEVVPADVSSFSQEELPSKYDSRNSDGNCYVTEVENQGYTYLCWAYAAIGAVESDILRHSDTILYNDLDLSEKHLAYYNVHKADSLPENGIEEDYRELINADDEDNAWIFEYDTNYVAVGGVTDYCISLLTAWKGPVSDIENDAFEAVFGQEYLFKNNTKIPSNAYNSEYHIQDVNQICASIDNINYVKQMVMEHGAATIGVNADTVFWMNHNSTLYSYFNGASVPTANHEVLIVGWDDDYSSSNFAKAPKADGAWICKNSWGTSSGNNGYFYLSYYDETVNNSNAASYSVTIPNDDGWYDNNYQVAGYIGQTVSTLDDNKNFVVALSESNNPYGVLFEANGEEYLNAVGLMALDTYQQYVLNIYINPQADGEQISFSSLSEPDHTQKISAISGGYHTFELDKELELHDGDSFFVMLFPVTAGKLVYEEATDSVSESNYDEWNNLTGNFHNHYTASERSYYIGDDGTCMEVQNDKDFFVKAYTNNK